MSPRRRLAYRRCVIDCHARTTEPRARHRLDPDLDGPSMRRLEQHRDELIVHCRRLLGSWSEADDAVQETLVRAWRGLDDFEGRSSLRVWLQRIATNVCLDMRRAKQRRARPMDPTSWPVAGGSNRDVRGVAWLDAVPWATPDRRARIPRSGRSGGSRSVAPWSRPSFGSRPVSALS
jgi:Sigma-70 region 2